jgi:hypothetical protein
MNKMAARHKLFVNTQATGSEISLYIQTSNGCMNAKRKRMKRQAHQASITRHRLYIISLMFNAKKSFPTRHVS